MCIRDRDHTASIQKLTGEMIDARKVANRIEDPREKAIADVYKRQAHSSLARSKDLSFFTSEEYTPEMERITAL